MPILGDNTCKILAKAKRERFVANLQWYHTSQTADSQDLTESVRAVTVNAATTWLAMPGCAQHTEEACPCMKRMDDTPKLKIELSVNDEALGRDLHQAINLMLRDQTDFHLKIVEKNGAVQDWLCFRPQQSQLYPIALTNKMYEAWLLARLRRTGVFAHEERVGAQLDYRQLMFKQLLGAHSYGRLASPQCPVAVQSCPMPFLSI